MKERMFKYFSANSTKRYIDVLDALVQQYNNRSHSTIKMTPVEASLKQTKTRFGEIYIPLTKIGLLN